MLSDGWNGRKNESGGGCARRYRARAARSEEPAEVRAAHGRRGRGGEGADVPEHVVRGAHGQWDAAEDAVQFF